MRVLTVWVTRCFSVWRARTSYTPSLAIIRSTPSIIFAIGILRVPQLGKLCRCIMKSSLNLVWKKNGKTKNALIRKNSPVITLPKNTTTDPLTVGNQFIIFFSRVANVLACKIPAIYSNKFYYIEPLPNYLESTVLLNSLRLSWPTDLTYQASSSNLYLLFCLLQFQISPKRLILKENFRIFRRKPRTFRQAGFANKLATNFHPFYSEPILLNVLFSLGSQPFTNKNFCSLVGS